MKYSGFLIQKALERHEFMPFYQPIVEAGTAKICGCEVLARWLHPGKGLIDAEDFIGSVEANNALELMTHELLDIVSMDLKKYKFSFCDSFLFSINCNYSLLMSEPFCERLVQLLHECLSIGMSLLVELSERQDIQDFPQVQGIIIGLRAQGVQFAIDDYIGTYSDYDRLIMTRPNYIKLDKRYLSHIDCSLESQRQIDDIIGLSHYLGFTLIAEGVESTPQVKYLSQKRINYWQGYLCGAPMPAELFYYHLSLQFENDKQVRKNKTRKLVTSL